MSESTGACGPAVVITGASSGIGAASAMDLDGRGYRVFAGVFQKLVSGFQGFSRGALALNHFHQRDDIRMRYTAFKTC